MRIAALVRGADEAAGRGWLAVSAVACLAGMATKEVMVSAPSLMLLADRAWLAGSFREAGRQRRGYYCALAATWLLLDGLVVGTGTRGGTAGFGVKDKPARRAT